MVARIAITLAVSADEVLGLKGNGHVQIKPSLRLMRRLHRIEKLHPIKQKDILRTIDSLVRDADR